MNREINQQNEWVCYNDTVVSTLRESWFTLVESCVQLACYPTVLFYEKLDPREDYNKSTSFALTDKDISDLFNFSLKMNRHHAQSVEEMFSQEEIQA
jgi:hypothetical protein